MEEIEKNTFGKLVRFVRQSAPLIILLASILVLHLTIISSPNDVVFDEFHYVTDARRILAGEGSERLEHPPLAKLIITGGMFVLGDNPWGWRLPAIALSTLALTAFFSVCRKLGISKKTAFLATMLLGLDNLMFIQSGLAMLDVYLVSFTIFAFWFYLKGLRWWWLSAVFIAFASLSKFTGVLAVIPIGIHWLFVGYRQDMSAPHVSTEPIETDFGLSCTEPPTLSCFQPTTPPVLDNAPIASASPALQTDSTLEIDSTPESAKPNTHLKSDSSPQELGVAPPKAKQNLYSYLSSKIALSNPRLRQFWNTYSRSLIFICCMILVPVVFFVFYGVFDSIIHQKYIPYFSWGKWTNNVLDNILRAISASGTLTFENTQDGPLSSRPWEWFLSPTGSFNFFGHIFDQVKYDSFVLPYYYYPHYTGIVSPSIWLGGLMTFPFVIWKTIKRKNAAFNAAFFVLLWIVGLLLVWIPLSIATNRVSFMFYYVPVIGAVAIGLSLILSSLLNKAYSLKGSAYKHILKLTVVSFIVIHLVSFCAISPLRLPFSIPICAALLLLSLIVLGLSRSFIIKFIGAACVAVAIVRLALYSRLYDWLVTGTLLGTENIPDVSLMWTASTLIGIILTWSVYAIFHQVESIILQTKFTSTTNDTPAPQ